MAESTQIQAPPPFAHELKISKDAEEWLKSVSPVLFRNYDQIQKTWNAPTTQFAISLAQDTEFSEALIQVRDTSKGPQLIGYELVLVLLLWIFRAWRLSKVSTLLTRIWTQAWIGLLFWFSAVFIVPGFVFGEAYRTILSHLFKAMIRHFFSP